MKKVINTEISPADFVNLFSPALQEYLEVQYRGNGHVSDLLAAASEFFGVSYHSVSSVLDWGHYTDLTASDKKLKKQ